MKIKYLKNENGKTMEELNKLIKENEKIKSEFESYKNKTKEENDMLKNKLKRIINIMKIKMWITKMKNY